MSELDRMCSCHACLEPVGYLATRCPHCRIQLNFGGMPYSYRPNKEYTVQWIIIVALLIYVTYGVLSTM